MPTFDTPQPVSARLSLGFVVANVRVTASDRTDTTVDVQPMDASSKADVKVAEQTRIEYADGRLEVRAPKLSTLFGRTGSVDVTITLPSGSRLQGETAWASSCARAGSASAGSRPATARSGSTRPARSTSAAPAATSLWTTPMAAPRSPPAT